MRRGRGWAMLAAMASGLAGCDGSGPGGSGQGVPPAPPPSETVTVAVVLPASGLAERDVWEAEARRDEVRTKALAEIRKPEPGDPPARQADLVREAARGGASAIIVAAEDPALMAPAVAEARELGVPVVLLDRPVAVPGAGPGPPLVRYEDAERSAKGLVDAALADAEAAGFPPGGSAVIVRNGAADVRVEALRKALDQAGVRVLPDATYSGYRDDARAAVMVANASAGGLAMVLAADEEGLRGAAMARHRLDRRNKRFVLAGYTADIATMELVNYNACAAIVDRRIREPIRVAMDVALALVRGETVASETIVPTPLSRATGPETLPPPSLETGAQMEKQDHSPPVMPTGDRPGARRPRPR